MKLLRPVVRYPLILVAATLALTVWRLYSKPAVLALGDAFVNNAPERNWFPNLASRLLYGAPDVWRPAPGSNVTLSTQDVIDPIADRTFFMLKTGVDVLYERLPVHLETTLKRFPHHQIYADTSAFVGGEEVVDVIDMIPRHITQNHLNGYLVRKAQVEEAWGWDSKQIKDSKGWDTDKFKNVPMMLHAYRTAPKHCDWFVVADDDTFIHTQSLGSLLRELNPRHPYYLGSSAMIRDGFTETGRVGEKLKAKHPDDPVDLWFAHGGSGYIVSRGAVEALFWDHQREDDLVAKYSEIATKTCCGDAAFGYMLREELELYPNAGLDHLEIEIDPFQGETLASTWLSVAKGGYCSRVLSWHHIKSWEIQKLFDWEQTLGDRKPDTRRGVLFSDYYHDFILPYALPTREHYDNGASSSKYSAGQPFEMGDESVLYPADSAETCMKTCEAASRCFAWKHVASSPSDNLCYHEAELMRKGYGSSPLRKGADPNNIVVSGYVLDRIRMIRSGEVCDPLMYDLDNETYNDNDEISEGWYFRKLAAEQNGQPGQPVL